MFLRSQLRFGFALWSRVVPVVTQSTGWPAFSRFQQAMAMSTQTIGRKAPKTIKRTRNKAKKKDIWSATEDNQLRMGIQHLGNDWESIAEYFLPHKDISQIKHRWMKSLSTRVKIGRWSPEVSSPSRPFHLFPSLTTTPPDAMFAPAGGCQAHQPVS